MHGSDGLDSRMGSWLWDLSLGQSTGDGRFDGETFLVGLLIFLLGGRGGRDHHGLHGAVGMLFMHMRSMLLYVICLLHVYVCYMLLYVICLL